MDLKLSGRTALITGASRGIGFGVAQGLATESCNLHLTSHNATDLEAARNKIMSTCKVDVGCHPLALALISREIYHAMTERKRGVIINIIGGAGERPTNGYLAGRMATVSGGR